MDAQSPHFGCFTLQKPSPAATTFISDVGSDGQITRTRKAHTKSRRGCTNCKERKIKCDEGRPCRNCLKRNQECKFMASPKLPSSMIKSRPQAQEIPTSASTIPDSPPSPMNLDHLRLLHHFQTYTFKTFILEPETWRDTCLDLALQNKFLMHTVFLMTANHLQHLQPANKGHQIVALEHLSQALPMFRKSIATSPDFKGPQGEAFIACSLLLLQYSWTYDSDGWGTVVGFYKGLAEIILEFTRTMHVHHRAEFLEKSNRFTAMLLYSPRLHIEEHMKDAPIPWNIQETFAHVLSCTKISDIQTEDANDFIEPSTRLMTILSVLQLNPQELELCGLMLDIARYLFSWPILLPAGFISIINREDGRAQVILLYYFAAVSRLYPERFWWMCEKGVYMYNRVFRSIGEKCTECTRHATEIFAKQDSD